MSASTSQPSPAVNTTANNGKPHHSQVKQPSPAVNTTENNGKPQHNKVKQPSRTGGNPPSMGPQLVNFPVIYPQQFATNRNYLLPNTIIPQTTYTGFPTYAVLPTLQQQIQQGQPFQQLQQVPIYSAASPGFFQGGQLITPLQFQQSAEREQFYKQLQASAQAPQGKVVPAAQQKSRDYSMDSYFYDQIRDRAMNPTLNRQQQQRGPGFYSVDELQLIPLQRVNAATTVSSGSAAPDGSLVAVTVNGTPAPIGTVAVTDVPQGSQTAIQQRFGDVPRLRLGPDQDNYLAGIAVAYNLLVGLLPLDQPLEDACRSFDIDEDTIAVTETQLETLLYNITEKQQSRVKQMLFTFPLHDRLMAIGLRVFIYGEIVTDPRTGFKRALTTLEPWSWRQALPTGDSSFRRKGEDLSTTSEEYLLRKKYHQFLVRFYSMIWRSMMRLRVEQTALFTPDYSRFIETTLAALRPGAQSVSVLEARIRALVARLQLLHGVFFNTAQFYKDADELKTIIHPLILLTISRYLRFTAV